jgi:uncharacterized membrane protein
MARLPPNQVLDPAIEGQYVDVGPTVTTSGNIPGGNPVKTTVQSRRTTIQAQAVSFQGPIPPPELLREYNEIVPNGADRIVKMAEAQSSHRIDLESIVIKGDDRRADRGLYTGFTIGIVMLVLSFIMVMYGHGVEGTIFGTADLAGLIGIFVYGRNVKLKELQRRDAKNQALIRRK